MSIKEIQSAITDLMVDDESITTVGNCRSAAERIFSVANAANLSEPRAEISLIVNKKSSDPYDPDVHYALKAESREGVLWVNTVPTPGYPEYNRITNKPPGLIGKMIETDKVI